MMKIEKGSKNCNGCSTSTLADCIWILLKHTGLMMIYLTSRYNYILKNHGNAGGQSVGVAPFGFEEHPTVSN